MFKDELFKGDRVTAFDADDNEMWQATVIDGGKEHAEVLRDDNVVGGGRFHEGANLWTILITNFYESKRWDAQDENFTEGYIKRTTLRKISNWKKQIGD